jgi:hypothetical protein
MVTNSNKTNNVFKILLILCLLLTSIFSVSALTQQTLLSEPSGWTAGETRGRDVAVEYNDHLYVADGSIIYEYDMNAGFDYIGSTDFTNTINEMKIIDNLVFITSLDTVKAYDLDNSYSLVYTYDNSTLGNILSFDVSDDYIAMTDGTTKIVVNTRENVFHDLITTGDPSDSKIQFNYDKQILIQNSYEIHQVIIL